MGSYLLYSLGAFAVVNAIDTYISDGLYFLCQNWLGHMMRAGNSKCREIYYLNTLLEETALKTWQKMCRQ
jgi:hypothetical protein